MSKINKAKTYIWAELQAGRSVTHLSVLHAIGSIKCQQRIFDLREELRKSNAPYTIETTMCKSADGSRYARYSLKKIPQEKNLFFN